MSEQDEFDSVEYNWSLNRYVANQAVKAYSKPALSEDRQMASEQEIPVREIRRMLRIAWGQSKYLEITPADRDDWYKDYIAVRKWLKEIEQSKSEGSDE